MSTDSSKTGPQALSEPPQPAAPNPPHSPATSSGTRWGAISGTAVVLALFFGAQFIAGVLIGVYAAVFHPGHIDTWINGSVEAQFFFILLAEALTLLGVYAFLRAHRSGFKDIGLVRFRPMDIGWGVLAAIAYFILLAVAIATASGAWHGLNVDAKQELGFDNISGTLPLILTFISLVVLPPITEEILVRGLLFSSLRKHLPLFMAALATSVLFAIPHLFEGGGSGLLWVAGIDTFVLSMVLCYVRHWTRSLWAGIIVHTIKNGIAFFALYIAGVH